MTTTYQPAANGAIQAHITIPGVLFALLTNHWSGPLDEVIDLGCGMPDPLGYLLLGVRFDVKKVHMVDPNLDRTILDRRDDSAIAPGKMPELIEIRDIRSAPIGMPCIAMHPGFGLPCWDDFTPPWRETLQKLRPPVISYCSYTEIEQIEERLMLHEIGYQTVWNGRPLGDRFNQGRFCFGHSFAMAKLD